MIERRGQQQGFSLLEVLVAFSILALSLGVLVQIFSSSVRGALVSESYNRGLILAESRLASVGIETPLEVGTTEGDGDPPYHWRVDVAPYQTADRDNRQDLQDGLYRVEVLVHWRDGRARREIKLETLRLPAVSEG